MVHWWLWVRGVLVLSVSKFSNNFIETLETEKTNTPHRFHEAHGNFPPKEGSKYRIPKIDDFPKCLMILRVYLLGGFMVD